MGLDPGQFFDAAAQTLSSPRLRIWREKVPTPPGWMFARIDQDIDDVGSVAWRGAVDDDIATHGYPRFMILDVHEVAAVNSIAMRFKSAGWARNLLQHLEQGVIYTGGNDRSGFVISTVLRLAGMHNATLMGSEDALRQAVDSYRSGQAIAGVPVRTD